MGVVLEIPLVGGVRPRGYLRVKTLNSSVFKQTDAYRVVSSSVFLQFYLAKDGSSSRQNEERFR